MVTLRLRQKVEISHQVLEDQVNRQVAEIVEAAEVEAEQAQKPAPVTASWNYSMPFAGVRYYSYDK